MKVLSLAATTRDIITAINQLIQGRSNATGEVTLSTGTSTVVTKTDIPPSAVVLLSPKTASAATTTWQATVGTGQFTITHAAGAADRTFRWVVIGG